MSCLKPLKLKISFTIASLCVALFYIVTLPVWASENTEIFPTMVFSDIYENKPNAPYQAILKSPRLSYLDTSKGLSQDSINDIHIDDDGFVWIANDEGLDRFDGSKILSIAGKNNELQTVAIYKILELDSGHFLLSTSNQGVLLFDRFTQELTPIIQEPFLNNDTWFQSATDLVSINNSKVLIALYEKVLELDLATLQYQERFSLSKQQIEAGSSIRSVYYHSGTLLIGYTDGLSALDAKGNMIKEVLPVDWQGAAKNVKTMKTLGKDYLYVGTVEGLNRVDLESLNLQLEQIVTKERNSIDLEKVDTKRNIWDIAELNDKYAYVGTDIGVFILDLESKKMQLVFEPRKNFEVMSEQSVLSLALTKEGKLWFGTKSSGAMYWSPSSLIIKNVYNSVFKNKNQRLSHNVVWSAIELNQSTLIIGTDNGLNKYDRISESVEQFLVGSKKKQDYSDSYIDRIIKYSDTKLWLLTGAGIRFFDLNMGEVIPPPLAKQASLDALNTPSYSIFLDKNNRLWSLGDAEINIIDLVNDEVNVLIPKNVALNITNTFEFIEFDEYSNQILLAASGELWGVNIDTFEFKLIHSIKSEINHLDIYPSAWLRINEEEIWVSYPSHGLFRISGNRSEKYSKSRGLTTNLIYSLLSDKNNNIWFSSHNGIHSLNPTTLSLNSYSYHHGFSSTEFNEGVGAQLINGEFLYGSNLGFSIFDPIALNRAFGSAQAQPSFTEVSIGNRKLSLPLVKLDNFDINLKSDDVGITFQYAHVGRIESGIRRFQYSISSDGETVNYPAVSSNKITFASLPPGKHTVELRSNSAPQNLGPATINITVEPPWFLSQRAYLSYSILCILLCVVLFLYGRKGLRESSESNQVDKQYLSRIMFALQANRSGIWEFDGQQRMFRGKRLVEDSLNQQKDEIMSLNDFFAIIHPTDKINYLKKWHSFIGGNVDEFDISYRVFDIQGKKHWYRDTAAAVERNGKNIFVRGVYTNISEQVAMNEKLKLLGNAFDHTRDWVLIFDENRRLIESNEAFKVAFRVSRTDLETKRYAHLEKEHEQALSMLLSKLSSLNAGDRWRSEFTISLYGKTMTVLTDINAVSQKDDNKTIDFYLIVATDISEQIDLQQRLKNVITETN